jgi:hypothetical protein
MAADERPLASGTSDSIRIAAVGHAPCSRASVEDADVSIGRQGRRSQSRAARPDARIGGRDVAVSVATGLPDGGDRESPFGQGQATRVAAS